MERGRHPERHEERSNSEPNVKPTSQEQDDAKAGSGGRHVRFWEPPEEFQVDYTVEEDVRQLVEGPQKDWGRTAHVPTKEHGGREGESAPVRAHQLVQEAQKLGGCEVLQRLEGVSDDLYAWAAARVARDPEIDFVSLMTEMATYGLGELANEAADLLEQGGEVKAGSARLQVHPAQWSGDGPGRGAVDVDGHQWHFMDYKEEVYMTEELAGILRLSEPSLERRQCVTLSLAAALFRRRNGRWPSMKEAQEQAQRLRLEQARLAAEAVSALGEAEEMVAAVEHEARIYVHDLITANHEKDFRSLAMFPVQELQEARIVVLRADYMGGLVVESIVGTHWEPGGWTLPVLSWKGHMVALQPPEGFKLEEFVLQEEYAATPALGFTFFWHSRHDQPKSAPGRIHCRLCRADRKAGEFAVPCRRHSCLAAVATMGVSKQGPTVLREVCAAGQSGGGPQLVLQEVFAGTGRVTEVWKKSGVAKEPIEVFEEPHQRRGYRADHDLRRSEVQQKVRTALKQREANVWWIAAPCTSYCDWQLQNGGSRTFEVPEGTGCGPLAEREEEGNQLSTFAAELFLDALEDHQFPVCESSASSGRYPKQWDLPIWKAILQREDVDYIDFPMCGGLGPPDEPGSYYVHKTRLVFPRHGPLRQVLLRQCPGVGPAHKHVALKGARDGQGVTRCTEAGAYAWDFVTAVVSVLQATLSAQGGVWFQPQLNGHAGGKRGRGEDEEERNAEAVEDEVVRAPLYQSAEELKEAAEKAGVDNQESVEEFWNFLVEGEEATTLQAKETEEESAGETGRWCTAEGLEQQNLIDSILGERSESEDAEGHQSEESGRAAGGQAEGVEDERHKGAEEDENEYEPSIADSEELQEEEGPEEAEDGDEAGDQSDENPMSDPRWDEPVVRDFWEAPNLKDGTVRRVHPVSRRHLFVPTAADMPWIGQVTEERRTILINHQGVRVRVDDNWKEAGEVNIGYGLWTGFTIFPLKNIEPNWERWKSYGWGEDGSYVFGSLALMQFHQHHTLRLPAFNGRGSRGSR